MCCVWNVSEPLKQTRGLCLGLLSEKLSFFCQTVTRHNMRMSLCFQCTPPQRLTLMSPLTPATTTRRGTRTWETGTAWTGWRTLMWWVFYFNHSEVETLYMPINMSIFTHKINKCVQQSVLTSVTETMYFLWRLHNKGYTMLNSRVIEMLVIRRRISCFHCY